MQITQKHNGSYEAVDYILKVDEPMQYSGRVYPRSVMQKAIRDYRKKIMNGTAIGMIEPLIAPELSKAAFKVTDMSLEENGRVKATIETLPTPQGRVLENMLNTGNFRLTPCSIASITKNNVVEGDLEIQYVSLLPQKDVPNV